MNDMLKYLEGISMTKCPVNNVHRWTEWVHNGNDHYSCKCKFCGEYRNKYKG